MTSEAITSEELFDRAQGVVPGGVNSPVRAFGSVGGAPRFLASARGAYVTDVDGREYVDLVGSWGPDEDDPDDEDADGPDADGSDTAESAGPVPGSRPNADGLDLNGWL